MRFKDSDDTYPEDIFDYFDEYPEDDPFMPKPTCHVCAGLGVVTNDDGVEWTCTTCGGTGCLK